MLLLALPVGSSPPRKWAPVHERWRGISPGLARWREARRIRGWERQLDHYFPLGLDELAEDLSGDMEALFDALNDYARLRKLAEQAQIAGHLSYWTPRRLDRAVRPIAHLADVLAAKYDLLQGRRYEYACNDAEREIPWDEWTRDNPTSRQVRRERARSSSRERRS